MSLTSRLFVLALVIGAAACGGDGSGSPTGGTTVISASTGSPGPTGATITVTANGISPSQVSITLGQSVTFINNDTRPHEFGSNPHPTHGTCPAIENGLATLPAGQTRLTHGFANAGSCGFHDHLNSTTANLMGTIVVR